MTLIRAIVDAGVEFVIIDPVYGSSPADRPRCRWFSRQAVNADHHVLLEVFRRLKK